MTEGKSQERPLVTFALFAYNQEQYIREAVEGAFSQTYEPLEIILSDDCSTDRTFEIMQEMAAAYDGPHMVRLNRNSSNQGLCPHINTVFAMAETDIVVVAAGDDASMPGRVAKTEEIFREHPDVLSLSMDYRCIDEHGNLFPRETRKFGVGKYTLADLVDGTPIPIYGCTRAYRSRIFEIFGPLRDDCKIEDATLRFRAFLAGSVYHANVDAIQYRVHRSSMSTSIKYVNQIGVFKQNIKDLHVAVRNGVLAEAEHVAVRNALRRIIGRGIILARHQQARWKLLDYLVTILPSRCFSSREKAFHLYRMLRGFFPPPLINLAKVFFK